MTNNKLKMLHRLYLFVPFRDPRLFYGGITVYVRLRGRYGVIRDPSTH